MFTLPFWRVLSASAARNGLKVYLFDYGRFRAVGAVCNRRHVSFPLLSYSAYALRRCAVYPPVLSYISVVRPTLCRCLSVVLSMYRRLSVRCSVCPYRIKAVVLSYMPLSGCLSCAVHIRRAAYFLYKRRVGCPFLYVVLRYKGGCAVFVGCVCPVRLSVVLSVYRRLVCPLVAFLW